MTITNTTRSVTAVGNGATTVWPYAFIIPDAASANVKLRNISTGVEEELSSSLWTIAGLNNPAGGTVTYPLSGSPLASTHQIIIYRAVAPTQSVSITNQTRYFADVVMGVWDRIVMMVQELTDDVTSSLRTPIGDDPIARLPAVADRASKFLAFDSSGDPIASLGGAGTVPISSAMEPVVSAATIKAAMDLLGVADAAIVGDWTVSGIWTATGVWTISDTWTFNADVTLTDNIGLVFGDSVDMRMYHNGSGTNIIQSNTHGLQLRSDFSITLISSGAGETFASFVKDGACSLYYNNAVKIATTAAGMTVTGALTVTGAITAASFTPTAQTPIATTSGTTHDFTGIPATATKIEVMLSGVSLSGADNLTLLLGDAGGFEVTGYVATVTNVSGEFSDTTAFRLTRSLAAGDTVGGIFTLLKITGNEWVLQGGVTMGTENCWASGAKTLSAVLTQIRLANSGSDTFDAGTFSIRYS